MKVPEGAVVRVVDPGVMGREVLATARILGREEYRVPSRNGPGYRVLFLDGTMSSLTAVIPEWDVRRQESEG